MAVRATSIDGPGNRVIVIDANPAGAAKPLDFQENQVEKTKIPAPSAKYGKQASDHAGNGTVRATEKLAGWAP